MKVKQPPLIRLVDDDPSVCESLAFVLEVAGLQVKGYSSALDFLAWDDREREALDVVWEKLTQGEREAAQLVAKGLTNKEIAGVLDISEEAVKSRRSAMLGKLDVRNAVEVAEFLRERERLDAALTPGVGGAS